jgi:hypothetical protein
MAGILDFLQSPDAQLGIGLLAAGGPTTDPNQTGFGQRLQGAMNSVTANQQIALRAKLMQSQIDENASQNALRQAQLGQQAKRDAYFMGDAGYAGPAAGAAAPGLPGSAGVQGGAQMAAPGVAAQGAPVAAGGDRFSQWSAQYGIPRDALVNDYLTNGGKGIAEMLAKAGGKDMQVSNGYVFDKNKVGAGYLPQLNMSQDGKASMVQIGQDGMPVVSAPRGAVDTYSAYQGAQANYKPIKVFNPQTQREEYTTEGAVVQPGRAPQGGPAGYSNEAQMRATAGGDMGADPKAIAREVAAVQNDLLTKKLDEPSRAMLKTHLADLLQQGQRIGAPAAASIGNLAAGPSMQEKATGQFNEKMATEQGDILTKGYTAANDAVSNLQGIQESRKAVQAGAFQGTGADAKLAIAKFGQAVGINIDPEKSTNTDYLKSTLGNGLLEKAKTLGSNPSNADASRITDIVGSIGKDPGAMAKILDWQEAMARKAIDQHNTKVDQASANGFKSQFDMHVKAPDANAAAPKSPGKVIDDLPKTASVGARVRDTSTGKVLKFDGLKWKEE